MAYSESLLGSRPIAGPVFLLTGNAVLASSLVVLLGYILCGWCTYLLVVRLTGSPWAGVVAGSLMAFSPVRVPHLSHLQLVTMQWLPVVLLLLDRLLTERRWRDVLWLIVFFNLQFLSSYYLGLFMVATVALVLLGYLLTGLARFSGRLAGQLAVFAVVTAAINLPLAWPYFEVSHAMGFARSLGEMASYSATLRGYLSSDPAHPVYGALLSSLRRPAPRRMACGWGGSRCPCPMRCSRVSSPGSLASGSWAGWR